jgi:hypothetical protein
MPRTRRPNKKGPDFASPYHQLKVFEGKKYDAAVGHDLKIVRPWYLLVISGHHNGDADGQVGRVARATTFRWRS